MNALFPARGAWAAAALLVTPLSFAANAQIAVSANDNKVTLQNGTTPVTANPPDDTVSIIDLSANPPKIVTELKAPSSVAGPPQTVAITPDGSLALGSSLFNFAPA